MGSRVVGLVCFDVEIFFSICMLYFYENMIGKKRVRIKSHNMVGDSGEDTPPSESAPFVAISDDDRSPSDSPRLSQTDPTSRSKPKGK